VTGHEWDPQRANRSAPAIRVLVADDHPLTRLGIRVALGDGFQVCAEAEDAEGALAAALREVPDICLLDVGMPGNGVQAAARIVAELPGVAVVMITAARDDETLFAALRAGALGYLPKEMALTRLPEALLGVLDGEAAVPRDVTARLLGEFRRRHRGHRLGHSGSGGRNLGGRNLTSRETDVLELLLDGLSTIEIGQRLYLTPPTVRSHVAAVMRKHAVRDRDALRALFDDPDRMCEGDRS
jgi:DNA-binding NarL/FixJ family response regulator